MICFINSIFFFLNEQKQQQQNVNHKVVLYLAVRGGREHNLTVREETLRAVYRGCEHTHAIREGT